MIEAKARADRAPRLGDGVAFYGSLMRGLGALEALPYREGLRYIGPCRVVGDLYDLGAYPGLRLSDQGATDATDATGADPTPATRTIQAELYSILDLRVVDELDDFEGFEADQPANSLYIRKRVDLIGSGEISPEQRRAWVYIYNHRPDSTQRVDSGDWRAHLLSRVKSRVEPRAKFDACAERRPREVSPQSRRSSKKEQPI